MEKDPNNTKPNSADLPPWDEQKALAATGGDAELARALLQTLVEGLPADLTRLRGYFDQANWQLLAESAHRMRGATSYCGVPALDTNLLELEQCAKSGDLDCIKARLPRVEHEAKRLIQAFKDL